MASLPYQQSPCTLTDATFATEPLIVEQDRTMVLGLLVLALVLISMGFPNGPSVTNANLAVLEGLTGLYCLLAGALVAYWSLPAAVLTKDGVICPLAFHGTIPWQSFESVEFTRGTIRLRLTPDARVAWTRSLLWRRREANHVAISGYSARTDVVAALNWCRMRIDPAGARAIRVEQAADEAVLATKWKRNQRLLQILLAAQGLLYAAKLASKLWGRSWPQL